MNIPLISFGIIVFNGEPFTRYNLRALYPYAHQIIIVEGACRASAGIANEGGHSTDGTLEILRKFKEEEDPDNKIIIVTAEDDGCADGFWPEKNEMSQAYAKRATGSYLWQVDIDEFYLERDMLKIIELLEAGASAVDFNEISFWGSIDYAVNGFWLITYPHNVRRLFAWGQGYSYVAHRPPAVVDANGKDTRLKRHITADQMQARGILLHHYSLLFPKQVQDKSFYYSQAEWCHLNDTDEWFRNCYAALSRPFRVHNTYDHISWLKRYKGPHPCAIYEMIDDINNGVIKIELRQTYDIEYILENPLYALASGVLEKWAYFSVTPTGKFFIDVAKGIYVKSKMLLHLQGL